MFGEGGGSGGWGQGSGWKRGVEGAVKSAKRGAKCAEGRRSKQDIYEWHFVIVGLG